MTIGPASVIALAAAVLATILWVVAIRLGLPDWLAMFLFAFGLAVVILAGPLIKLP